MNKSEKQIIEEKKNQVSAQISSNDFLAAYAKETLSNFAFRYFEAPSAIENSNDHSFAVSYLEKGIKEAIKIKNPQLRSGIGELVKRVTREEGPTILYRLQITFKEQNANHSGVCQISARISFGHPDHQFVKGSFVEKTSILNFEDEMQFRNTLAKYLEDVCALFE